VGVIGASACSRLVLAKLHAPSTVVLLLTTDRAESLAIGALIAFMLRQPGGPARLRAWQGPIALTAAAGCVGLYLWRRSVSIDDPAISTLGVTFASWLAAAAIIRFTAGSAPGTLQRVFSARVPRFFGKYSYGIYIWHYPIMILLARHGITIVALTAAIGTAAVANPLYVAINLGLAITAALVSWTLLERPMLGLKRYFEYPSA
jgi:peptidoglycan/LPS O-acetylase OafA/YrhL